MGIENKEHEGNKQRITGAELRVTLGSLQVGFQPRGEFRDRQVAVVSLAGWRFNYPAGPSDRLGCDETPEPAAGSVTSKYLNAPSQTSRELGEIKASKTTLGISACLSAARQ